MCFCRQSYIFRCVSPDSHTYFDVFLQTDSHTYLHVFFQAQSYYIFAFGCSHQQTTLMTTLVTPTPFLLTANSEGCNLLYSLRGSLVLLGRPDFDGALR